jgi:hypothetical protein
MRRIETVSKLSAGRASLFPQGRCSARVLAAGRRGREQSVCAEQKVAPREKRACERIKPNCYRGAQLSWDSSLERPAASAIRRSLS